MVSIIFFLLVPVIAVGSLILVHAASLHFALRLLKINSESFGKAVRASVRIFILSIPISFLYEIVQMSTPSSYEKVWLFGGTVLLFLAAHYIYTKVYNINVVQSIMVFFVALMLPILSLIFIFSLVTPSGLSEISTDGFNTQVRDEFPAQFIWQQYKNPLFPFSIEYPDYYTVSENPFITHDEHGNQNPIYDSVTNFRATKGRDSWSISASKEFMAIEKPEDCFTSLPKNSTIQDAQVGVDTLPAKQIISPKDCEGYLCVGPTVSFLFCAGHIRYRISFNDRDILLPIHSEIVSTFASL